ncbi:MAG: XdhC family protein [Bacteroidota bacterium]
MITHELKKIVEAYEKKALRSNIKAVLGTVVALEGSSYRRPGVRMLLLEDGTMIGAVSGGCVEKEVYRQALSVFKTDRPKVMTYDGRYRLGCEGILYILLEPFLPSLDVISKFWSAISERKAFGINSYFKKEHGENRNYGSVLRIGNASLPLRKSYTIENGVEIFGQILPPCFQLVLCGAEHDAIQMCAMASLMGWEVTVVVPPEEQKSQVDFPGANHFVNSDPESFELKSDDQTAVLLMTHSYVRDLRFLMALRDDQPAYFGILGPARRREKLFHELLEKCPDTTLEFIESVYGPAGLELGAETPQEIALSVLSEILSTINRKTPVPLREKSGKIHS